MSSGHKGTNTLNIFGWKWHGESSITTSLLHDVPPEIELSDYRRVPSPSGSESPSGLLNGESLKAEPITDLDLFFERLYNYYCEKGLWCIIVKWIVELLSLAFTICFSGFFLLYVDWTGLRNAKCGIDAVESGTRPCDLAKEALHQHPLTPFTFPKAVILGYLGIFSIYWIFCFLRFFAQLKYTLRIRNFYYNSLHVTDDELQTMPWASVLEKVVQVQNMQQLCVVKDLSAHDMIMRLMRKENYLIGMINKGVLAFPISKWFPGAGPTVKVGPSGGRQRLILTKTLEWTLNWSILQSMFDRNFCIRRDFITNPSTLKKRLMVVGLVMLLLSPFLVIFMLVYLFLRHAEQFYNHPAKASSRRWSNLSRWMFREFNEVEHLFRHRINSSIVHASDYLKQFPTPIISIIAKFISFISGGFAAVLIIIAFLDESLLEGQIFGRNLFWYAAVFGAITAVSRAAVTDDLLVLEPERAMTLVVQHTHYMPKRWRGKENTETVRMEFETLFQYTAMMWLEEMASIFLTPYLLIFVVPKRVDDILQFIADYTVNVEGVGHVCSFSTFDFQNHGNSKYASPYNSSWSQRSSQGKMEKSFLSFQCIYPSWEPDAQGLQFLSTLRTFRDQHLGGPFTGHELPLPRMWRWSPNLTEQGTQNCYLRREACQSRPVHGRHWGSLWMIEPDQWTHPYLLDWYYTSNPHHRASNSEEALMVPVDIGEQPLDNWGLPPFHDKARHEEQWGSIFEDRSHGHLEASTSMRFFEEQSVLRQHDSSNVVHPTRSHWWARRPLHGSGPQASFLEPPDFNRHSLDNYYDSHSERSMDEQEQQLWDWRNRHRMSHSTFTNDFDTGGEFKLHFDDVYRPPEMPSIKTDPSSGLSN
ncbi:autophagy protein atg9 [Ancistrocladus abbreviatus]